MTNFSAPDAPFATDTRRKGLDSPRILVCGWYRGPKLGVGVYLEQLLSALGDNPETANWTLITNTNTLRQSDISHWKGRVLTPPFLDRSVGHSLWFNIFALPKWAHREGFSAIVLLTNPVVLSSSVPVISVIHDLNEYLTFQKYGFWRTLYRKRIMLPSAIRNSRRLIAVSETTARQIEDIFGSDAAGRTKVIHNGSSIAMVPEAERNAIFKSMCLVAGSFFLIPGRIDPRGKNLLKALELFDALDKILPGSKLVLVGGIDTFARAEATSFLHDIESNPRWRGLVHYAGFVDERTKSALYAGAKAVLFLSRHEGFGLPIVEAFSHSCPVIYNKECEASCEIAGTAGIPFDESLPIEESAITVKDALTATACEARAIRMAEVVAKFSWDRAAKMYVDTILSTVVTSR